MTPEDALDFFTPDAVVLPPFSEQEKQEAETIFSEIDTILAGIRSREFELATNYAALGAKLLRVRETKYWLLTHRSFGAYIESLRERLAKGRTQLYQVIGVAEKLLPSVSEQDLTTMGISKAIEIKKLVTQTGRRPSAELIQEALNPESKVEDIRAAVYRALNREPEPKGRWMDFGGFYVDEQEAKEIHLAIDMAKKTDPVIDHTKSDAAQLKEVLLKMARECISSWAPEFYAR